MFPSPWMSIVLLGVAITGYAWMMPKKSGSRGKESGFVSEAAYDQLLEDLETENRELLDAVANFKKEQDETVDKLGRRIVDMEHQMRKWQEQSQSPPAAVPFDSKPLIAATNSFPSDEILAPTPTVQQSIEEPVVIAVADVAEVELPPTTIRGRYPALLEMHDKGRSVEQIAKAMGMNKGEVQLILQLARREEQHHA
ncbi:hypothetical protein [Cohnella silvisoli]|uniref:DUF2802 domain-containing protein n=1 Tax=Cohnella silvisoli TaxID=2873699 RepID=A0ABV1KV65_9BACL|nr:hypothetical protein [Cohnella silvisoli]MCD9023390.1 hypothetical protein [Cohnella silvisoli]